MSSGLVERVKYSISVEMEVPSCESMRYLPDSLIVRFDKKKEYTEQIVSSSKVMDDKIGSDPKLRLFIEIFRALAGDDMYDVKKENLVEELINTNKFGASEQEVISYVKEAQQNGFILERRTDVYALA